MFNTSQDLLYIALAFCILWFTVFLCWLLYQAARFLKNANDIVENLSNKLELIADAVEFIRSKVDKATDHMGAVSSFVSGTVGKLMMNKLSNALEKKVTKKKSTTSSKKK